MTYFLIFVCCIMTVLIIILYVSIMQKNTKIKSIEEKINSINKLERFWKKEATILQNQIKEMENTETEEFKIKPMKVWDQERKYNNIFQGKKAIIGNYDTFFREQTRKMLRYFGLSVDVVTTGIDLYDKIANGYKYDIIFTNRIYQNGFNGEELLHKLRNLDNFNTPVVVHTISTGKREYFVNCVGFDEYLEKPIQFDALEKILNKLLLK